MLRTEVEQVLKEKKITSIDIIYNENDKLAVYCRMKNGKLYDYTDHVVNRKVNIWGYLEWKDGKSTRRAWNG